jgi:hypothetical protein
MLPVYSVRDVPGLYRGHTHPPPLCFSQVLILKIVKVLCFDTLLQVLILNVVSQGPMQCRFEFSDVAFLLLRLMRPGSAKQGYWNEQELYSFFGRERRTDR